MTAAPPISRALRQSDRSSATKRPIAPSTSAALAVSATPAIASRAVSENSTAWGEIDARPTPDPEDPAGIARRFHHGPRSAIFAANRRRGSRASQMIDGRRGEDGEPDRLKARRFLMPEARQGAIELDRLQKSEPIGGERGQALETILRLGLSQRSAQILAEISRNRQPVHHRTSGAPHCIGGPPDQGAWNSRNAATEAPRADASRSGANFGSRRLKKARDQRSALASSRWCPSTHLQPLGYVRRHQLHPKRRRDSVSVANLGSIVRNQGQDHTFPLGKPFQKIYCRSRVTVNHITANDVVK